MVRIRRRIHDGNLVGMEGALDRDAIQAFRTGPALGRAQDDHWPGRTHQHLPDACPFLDGVDLSVGPIHSLPHIRMHRFGLIARHHAYLVAIAGKQAFQFRICHASQQGRTGELVAIQVQDGEHRTGGTGVQVLVGMPGCRQRASFGLPVTYDTGHNQIQIVERCPVGVRKAVTQLATFVDHARGSRKQVAGHPVGPGKLAFETPQAGYVEGEIRIVFAQGSFQIQVGKNSRRAVPRPDDEQDRGICILYQTVQVGVDQVQPGLSPPMAEQAGLDVLGRERLLQEGIFLQIELGCTQIVSCTPIGVKLFQTFL